LPVLSPCKKLKGDKPSVCLEADMVFAYLSPAIEARFSVNSFTHPLVALPLSAIRRYERHLSAVSMVGGFAFDNYYLDRVDHPLAQFALFAYVLAAIVSIGLVHFIESRAELQGLLLKAHPLLVVTTQFSLGALWSAFLIFYGRSAVIAASWPFLLILAGILVGNEVFRKYQSRLAFTCTLLFFALFSYAIFMVPVVMRQMGPRTFLFSGAVAVAAFCLVLMVLWRLGPARMRSAWRGIAIGAAGVLVSINLCYFGGILPPLPLTLAKAGVFHSMMKTGDIYQAVTEPNSLLGAAGKQPIMHVGPGESLSVYSAVFAPIQLRTNIVHIWQRYDENVGWQTQSVVSFPITGGRDGGYRGYSTKSTPRRGRWRVDIATAEGLLIGRVRFSVMPGKTGATSVVQILK
jgi:hypothetical protein